MRSTRVEYESIKETLDVLSDVDIMKQLDDGKKDDTTQNTSHGGAENTEI